MAICKFLIIISVSSKYIKQYTYILLKHIHIRGTYIYETLLFDTKNGNDLNLVHYINVFVPLSIIIGYNHLIG